MQKILVDPHSLAARIHRRELVATRVVGLLHEAQAAGRRLQQDLSVAQQQLGNLKERNVNLALGAMELTKLLKTSRGATDETQELLTASRACVADAEHHLDESVEARKRLETTFLEQLRKKVDNNERLRCLLSEKMAVLDIQTIENGRLESGIWLYQRAAAALAVLLAGALATIAFI